MKMLIRLGREAIRYRKLYLIAILSTLCLTGVNLAAPRVLSAMTGLVEQGIDETKLPTVGWLTAALVALYAGFRLWGFWGMVLAPVGAAVAKNLGAIPREK